MVRGKKLMLYLYLFINIFLLKYFNYINIIILYKFVRFILIVFKIVY